MQKLANKVAVITGGSSGIGLATAKKFIEEEAYVFIFGRKQSELDKVKIELGKNVTTIQGDVSNLDDLDRLYKIILSEKGVLDIVVACAGVSENVLLTAATPEHFDKIFNTNARGVFFTVQKALPLMKNGGSIVLISSSSQAKGFPALGAYSASKAAVRSFARTWTVELKDSKIRVNTVSPGIVDTSVLSGQFKTKEELEKAKAMFINMTPLGRIAQPAEIADTILFLASDDSSYITASDLVIDGGGTQV